MDFPFVVTLTVTIITTLAQVITLVFVISSALSAKKSAEAAQQTIAEMKAAREQENAPYVVSYIDMNINPNMAFLIIKNVGKTIAKDVKMKFTPPLESVVAKNISDIPLIKNGIPALPPNYEVKTLFDGVIQRFGRQDLPLTYTVEISYSYGKSQEFKENSTQILDLSMYLETIPLRKKDIDDVAKASEEIAKNTKEIYSSINNMSSDIKKGLWIKNPFLALEGNVANTDSWQNTLVAKLKEFQILWQAETSNEDHKRLPSYPSDLQTKTMLISGQLLIILSTCPINVTEEFKNTVSDIAIQLSLLGGQRFYFSQLENEFNTLGDSISKAIENTIKQAEFVNLHNVEKEEYFD